MRSGINVCPRCKTRVSLRNDTVLFPLVLLGSVVAVFLFIVSDGFRGLVLLGGIIFVIAKVSRDKKDRAQASFEATVEKIRLVGRSIFERHKRTLLQQRRRLVSVDPYGWEDATAWDRHFESFVDRHLRPSLPEPRTIEGQHEIIRLIIEFESWVIEEQRKQDQVAPSTEVDVSVMDPIEYEKYCARLLSTAGWKARSTQASGDQGVDVIAERDGFLLVLQVKRYQGSVGNSAVQEIIAAKTYMCAQGAAVVCYGNYTRSAIDLAESAGVLLLHHRDLPFLTTEDFGAQRFAAEDAQESESDDNDTSPRWNVSD